MPTEDPKSTPASDHEHPILEVFNADDIVDDPQGEPREEPSTTSDTEIPSPG